MEILKILDVERLSTKLAGRCLFSAVCVPIEIYGQLFARGVRLFSDIVKGCKVKAINEKKVV